jgi:beta-mannosidase
LGFPKDLKSFVYLSQFNQAEAIKTGVEHWRLRKFKTSGTLYWQFNDCWPVASWSAVDYYKREKALYYYSKRFYAKILPYIKEENEGITIYGISDFVHDKEAEMTIKVFKLNGEKIAEKQLKARLIANDVTKIAYYSFGDLNIGYSVKEMPIAIPGCTLPVEKNGELLNSVVYVEIITDDTVYENYKVFGKFRDLDLAKPKIDHEVRENKIILRADVPAFGVFIETEDDMELSDNCLNMMPDKKYEVSYSGKLKEIKIFDITQLIANI